MTSGDDTWAAIRQAYVETQKPLTEIASAFGVTARRIRARAQKEGWPERAVSKAAIKRSPANKVKKATANETIDDTTARRLKHPAPLPTRGAQRALLARLYRAISLKLEHMEKRMASGETRSAQDEERESRALATLVNNFEKITEAVAGLDKDGGAARTGGRTGADAERMRREIAERLERLGSLRSPGGGSRGPRS